MYDEINEDIAFCKERSEHITRLNKKRKNKAIKYELEAFSVKDDLGVIKIVSYLKVMSKDGRMLYVKNTTNNSFMEDEKELNKYLSKNYTIESQTLEIANYIENKKILDKTLKELVNHIRKGE